MKYFALILMLLSTSVIACSSSKQLEELPAFSKVLQSSATEKVDGIAVFVPTIIEGATATKLRVSFFENEELILQTSVELDEVLKDDEEMYNEVDLNGYSVGYLYADRTQIKNILLTTSYEFPPTKSGGIIMCGPMRSYKLHELMR
ncbi:hypothetical protein RGQ13_15085 [Thalassotalea psychrophila]|uniref:Lipoprotein n=1 Tax=Thalassotalea psychrophila TaxID=3065647 RepID=A0ABY9TSM5_9GAMM|nr:hypothetical protein RGQ13_15085 [Colwelliaceae bacterium SQ149]